jgi:hypothetical protein
MNAPATSPQATVNKIYGTKERCIEKIRSDMQEHHAMSKSWQKTGEAFNVNKAMARLLANGYNPGKKVRIQLHLDKPRTSSLRYTRTRRERLDELAQKDGFPSWSAFETHKLKEDWL